ncbi:sorting nexin-2-like [Anneissia japonica]|uniref:sorting nexin-2-like n=1 Tax=Anneissia japonica TaxID=1529436 RepID=UPI001425A955|nr:sorting nexin-2-like [Anneissia japonica]
MADEREPPPLFEEEGEQLFKEEDKQEEEDIFKDASETKPTENEKQKELSDSDDLFGDGTTKEISLDDAQDDEPANLDAEPIDKKDDEDDEPVEDSLPSSPATATATTETVAAPGASKAKAEEKNDESDLFEEDQDKFEMEIVITDPQKVGDGMMGSYMAYKVNTKTSNPAFKKSEMSVMRRFSDFLGLYQKLSSKHATKGIIVPPAPEKSVVGMTKVKMAKTQEETTSMEFIEKRRASLARFLNRTANHPQLCTDSDFVEFLEKDDLPKATNTQALSGAGVMRVFNKVADAASKATSKMTESDQWFEEKQNQVDNLEQHLKKLHASVENMVLHRKDLGLATGQFAKSAAMLGNSEEHTALSRAISQLAETEEKIDALHMEQANTDFFIFSELLKDYVGLIGAVKLTFREREKCFHVWQNAQAMLAKKRETEAKLQSAGKPDKLAQVKSEIKEWEEKVEKGQEEFGKISKTIRKEVSRFEHNRVRDFREVVIKYLEALMDHQQQLIKEWENFLPEAKAIA